ncbi:efflux RND transporter periplasmic adaptor subunit [Simplicispira sedimenti]|uniref:efflux RND transporter periplasmic adaptor subunit n=1 Tax=Simplicispira sedimenti TaxID=2919500 RepID=UPI001FA97C71|nr:efflux RND transporter periplasmic adaptor subunit [Acidovorax sp. W1-6]
MTALHGRRALVAGALVLLLVGAAWLAARPAPVDAVQPRQGLLVRSLQFSARVESLTRVELGSTVTARVARVAVDEGAHVRAGQVLVQLESDEAQAALAQAQAVEQQARARLAGLRGTGRQAAQAALAQADASVRAARAQFERVEPLVAQGFYSPAQRDEARRALDVALAQQAAAQAQWQAQGDAGADTAQAQAQWDAARAATQAAQARLAQTALRAGGDGRVILRSVEPGQIVQPGKALLTLALDGPTQLVAQVDERFLQQLQPGQRAAVLADAFAGQPFAARVQSLAPGVDAQRGAIEVKLALEKAPPDFLREDMTLSVEVETGRSERALALPLSVLRTPIDGDVAQLLVARDGRAELRRVRVGLRTLDAFAVQEGLSAEDWVLRAAAVQPGQRVRPRPVPWEPAAGVRMGEGGAAGAALAQGMGR